MIGISAATDGFFGIARVETMISFSRCLYMADAIWLAAEDSSELLVNDSSVPRLRCDLRGQALYKQGANIRLVGKIRMYL